MVNVSVSFIFNRFLSPLKLRLFVRRFHKTNDTEIVPQNIFNIDIVEAGPFSYGPLIVHSWRIPGEKLVIGRFVSIATGVTFILAGNHRHDVLST